MKVVLIILLVFASSISFSQSGSNSKRRTNTTKSRTATSTQTTVNKNNATGSTTVVEPRQTITEQRLNGQTRRTTSTTGNKNSTSNNSPFVGGIHPADNATIKTFDSVQLRNPNAVVDRNTTNATIAGGNDTTFNANAILNQGGVTTNSGAVDRSGQSQFGQTNWGNSRSTVGESQWTIPPPITASFSREFPSISNATWSRNNVDTSIYSARYQSGAGWITTNFNTSGQRLDTKSEIALLQPPRPVSTYIAKQPSTFQPVAIYFLQMQGKPDVYEITTRSGKIIYVNNEGMEVKY